MKFVNRYNLPESIYRACAPEQFEPNPKRIGVTDLIGPPQIRQLKIKHWDEIEVDASSRLWAVLGEGVHLVMDKHNSSIIDKLQVIFKEIIHLGKNDNTIIDRFKILIKAIADLIPKKDNVLIDRKLEYVIGDTTIVGVLDNFDITETGIIEDNKCTSVYSFLLGIKTEWTEQLNVYAWLAEKNGIHITGLRINAFLRDWQASKAVQADYPAIPFQSVEIPLWNLQKIDEFVRFRLAEHEKGVMLCTDEERWCRPDVWAVMKEGRKSAVACNSYLDGEKTPFTKEDAQKWMSANTKKGEKLYLQQRKGSCIRCENYCMVNTFCPQYKNKGD